jgi:hypothetical protein
MGISYASAVIVFCYFLLLCASLGAPPKQNQQYDSGYWGFGVKWHSQWHLTIVDVDYWRVECYPEISSVSLFWCPYEYLVCLWMQTIILL